MEGFNGPWWRYPPLRNALLAGLIAGAGFVLAHLDLIPERIENVFYWLAIPLGGWHWSREGIEELIEEKEVGIEILMLAATAGSGVLGLWDEAAALVFLYGAAEGDAARHRSRLGVATAVGGGRDRRARDLDAVDACAAAHTVCLARRPCRA